ncbi:ABC transporter permease [Kineosporia mesophila]|uniref:ABC transporter permease n=1 Tax=Kineosporia mesophila TaxID=566012 RepID=A0ABP6ZLD4_9ACTN|nr:ABC transporter permease [Kineosporia mesophila]MCD5350578.1 ABC transporter permease [Kineosporia mesophila]
MIRSAWTQFSDLLGDVLDGLLTRPGRFFLLIAMFAIGSGGFVAAAGISRSAADQITSRLTPSDLDQVMIREADPGDLPEQAESRVQAVNVVRAAGTAWPVEPGTVSLSGLPERASTETTTMAAPVYGAGPSWLKVQEAVVIPAGAVDHLAGDSADHVAVVGAQLSRRMNLASAGPGAKIWVNGRSFDLVGVLESSGRDATLGQALIISPGAIRELVPTATGVVTVRTMVGAASAVSKMIATTVRPDAPGLLQVDPVVDLANLRRGVATDLDRSVATLSFLVLAFAALTCGNAMVVTVIARTGEIGLRRAMGASRTGVAALFLTEGVVTGVAGGLLGSVLGLAAVLGVAEARGWAPVASLLTVPMGPLLGLLVGVVAALYPAMRAAAIPPAQAVRHTA